MSLRKLHRKTAPILFIPLLLTALTGIAYRIGRSWFGLSDEFGDFMMVLHEGRFLGKPIVPIYVLLVGLGLLGMIVSGITLIKQRKKAAISKPLKLNERTLHQVIAPIAFLPFAVSAVTGVFYRLGRAWFGLSDEQAAFLLKIHQGSYLGSTLRPVYVLLVGVSLIAMLLTGIQMSGVFRRRSFRSTESD
ncbi:MAG: PepSY domain-containing protein [Cyanobacteria bacterium J069]|nr:MAG: PepSY domain-containing protein [Cyanobacteria bacterium J069]